VKGLNQGARREAAAGHCHTDEGYKKRINQSINQSTKSYRAIQMSLILAA
jgi:hypothetical protein